jgi:hypothetical protein
VIQNCYIEAERDAISVYESGGISILNNHIKVTGNSVRVLYIGGLGAGVDAGPINIDGNVLEASGTGTKAIGFISLYPGNCRLGSNLLIGIVDADALGTYSSATVHGTTHLHRGLVQGTFTVLGAATLGGVTYPTTAGTEGQAQRMSSTPGVMEWYTPESGAAAPVVVVLTTGSPDFVQTTETDLVIVRPAACTEDSEVTLAPVSDGARVRIFNYNATHGMTVFTDSGDSSSIGDYTGTLDGQVALISSAGGLMDLVGDETGLKWHAMVLVGFGII